jgi:hypothetical protein
VVGVAAGLAPWAAVGRPVRAAVAADAVALPDTLTFAVRYGRTEAEGMDLVWRGLVGGPVPGRMTILIEYAGDPRDWRMPAWPVNAWLLFSADDLHNSFAAEASGTMNWSTGDLRVAGMVSDGARRDTAVEYRMRVTRPELSGSGSVVFYPRIALSPSR